MHNTTVLHQPVFAGFSSCFVHGRKYNQLIIISFIQEEVMFIQCILIINQRSERTANALRLTLWRHREVDLDLPTAPGLPCRPACCSQQSQGTATRGADNSATGAGIVYFKTTPSISLIFHFKARPWWENQSALFWILGNPSITQRLRQ